MLAYMSGENPAPGENSSTGYLALPATWALVKALPLILAPPSGQSWNAYTASLVYGARMRSLPSTAGYQVRSSTVRVLAGSGPSTSLRLRSSATIVVEPTQDEPVGVVTRYFS